MGADSPVVFDYASRVSSFDGGAIGGRNGKKISQACQASRADLLGL
mgnify:CR=1 FL=1